MVWVGTSLARVDSKIRPPITSPTAMMSIMSRDINFPLQWVQSGAFAVLAHRCIAPPVQDLVQRLDRPIVLVGLMGVGKSTVGRRLARRLGLPFVDSDSAIEDASGLSAAEVFERYGEEDYRDGERRLVARLIDGEVRGSTKTPPPVAITRTSPSINRATSRRSPSR